MLKSTTLAMIALTALLASHSAEASTLDVVLGAGPSGTNLIVDPGTVSLTSNISLTDLNTEFFKTIGSSLSGGVLTVGNGNPYSGYGYADFAITNPIVGVSNVNEFGFTWVNPTQTNNFQIETSAKSGGLGSFTILGSTLGNPTSPLNIVIIDPNSVLTSVEFDSFLGNGITTGLKVSNFSVGSSLSSVPLPGSVVLFLTALAGLFLLRRKSSI